MPHALYCEPMPRSTHKLLSLLISMLLVLAPFAAFDVAAAVEGSDHCKMMDAGGGPGGAQNVQDAGKAASAMPDCPFCQDNGCTDSDCAGHSCNAGHSLSVLTAAVMPVQHRGAAAQLAGIAASLLSFDTPPLLRPPVSYSL